MIEDQAACVRAVIGDNSGDSSAQYFTATTNSQVHPLDATVFAEIYERGGFVRVTPEGGDLWYIFSTADDQEVNRAIAATAAGTTDPELGGHIRAGDTAHLFVPNECPHFARESDSDDTTVLIEAG